MAKRFDYYIGIDPDVDKSGVAVWNGKEFTQATCLALHELFEVLTQWHNQADVYVRLEGGWLIDKSNFSTRNIYGSRSANERIAKNVGANHEVGRQIKKYCVAKGIPYQLVKPAGYSKYTHDHFCTVTQWPKHKRTNSEVRVACMLVYGY